MPLQSRWPLFESSASTCLPSASSASAKYSPSSTQKSRLKRRFRSAACCSSSVRERRVLPDYAREPRAAHLRVVRVALQLAGRAREAGQPPVAVGDRVPGVLPALVLEAGLLVAALVRDVAVALEVGVLVDPVERRPRLALELADELAVARPALVLVEQDDVERRRVGAAVVRRVRPLLERRHLAVAHLVEDPARVLVAEVVDAVPCQSPSARRVVAASSGVNGSACRLVKMLSRPNMVMNHGSPAAGRLLPPGGQAARSAARRDRRGCAGRSPSAAPSRTRGAARPASQRSRLAAACSGCARFRPRSYLARTSLRRRRAAVDDVEVGRPLAVRLEPHA